MLRRLLFRFAPVFANRPVRDHLDRAVVRSQCQRVVKAVSRNRGMPLHRLHCIEGRVEDNAVRVHLRIERARRVMCEQRSGKVARAPMALCPSSAGAGRRESLEFVKCRPHRPRVSLKNTRVLAKKFRGRNRLRRREGEIVESAPIGRTLATFCPRCVQPLCRNLARCRMLILAKPQKVVGTHLARQTEPLRSLVAPVAVGFLGRFERARQRRRER